ncbi:MAG: hypothetical protein MUO23_14955, partial [Anaerolineales bacterium]|nr:hypothetical protein [Anaerolineales bacterium]
MSLRRIARQAAGAVPIAPGMLQQLRPGNPPVLGNYRLERLSGALPRWLEAAERARRQAAAEPGRPVLLVAWLPWWLEYSAALALLLAGQGASVHLAYVPDRNWRQDLPAAERERQSVYVRRSLQPVGKLVRLHELRPRSGAGLPSALAQGLEAQSRRDVQYIQSREEIDPSPASDDGRLLEFRRRRNLGLAASTLDLLRSEDFRGAVIPNGSLLDFGVAYRVARHVQLPVITYEFGEQRERIWLAGDDEVMLQDTEAFWNARRQEALSAQELANLRDMTEARRQGRRWENFGRQWQAGGRQGAESVRQALGLDPHRPVAVLCTNVVGDSLALGRQVFSEGMADWLRGTVRLFGGRHDVQLVVRVHPGESLGTGLPSTEIVHQTLPDLPGHVTVVPPDSPFNTYDVIDLADLGLVYTTTAGLEMAMAGVPVVVAGRTHYRGRGFTLDPETWEAYAAAIDSLVRRPRGDRLSREQVDLAWRYAYRFFFDYPFPFPWHLVRFWEDEAA